MSARTRYKAKHRTAIGRILTGRTEVSLGMIERELRELGHFDVPARTTLAKLVTGLGWMKATHTKRVDGTVYRCPPADAAQ